MEDVDIGAVASAVKATQARRQIKHERTSTFTFRVTSAERALLLAVADLRHESVSAFVRSSSLHIALKIVESKGLM